MICSSKWELDVYIHYEKLQSVQHTYYVTFTYLPIQVAQITRTILTVGSSNYHRPCK